MRGVIRTKDVLANLGLVWREFGALCVLRCLAASLAQKPTTFLDIAFRRTDRP